MAASRTLLAVYHHLPGPLRSMAASLWGYRLRSVRYGRETERLVEEALERENWSPDQWRRWREERLGFVLHRAATVVPHYREQWRIRQPPGDRPSWAALERWPLLEKETLRAYPRAFVAEDCDPGRMVHDHTSGTTGTPLDLWFRRETVRTWYALFEARCRRWYGVSRHDRWAIVGGQLVAPVAARRPPFWVWNAGLRQLYLSAYHLAPDLIPHYLEAIASHRVTSIIGYTSALEALAREVVRLGRSDLGLRVAITNAEPLFESQREIIARAFRCPVRETYGMAEIAAAASECQAGRMHLWPEVGVVEMIEDGQPVSRGGAGDLVCTGLMNADMPLIRYRVGDRGALAAEEKCSCGRTLPLLAAIEGRRDDVLYTRDGRKIGRLDPVFKAHLPIREAQVVQESLTEIRVCFVPTEGYTPTAGETLAEELRRRLGPVRVILDRVSEIPRAAGGKFRAVVCNLSAAERRALDRR